MPLDKPVFPAEVEIALQAAILTSSGCTAPALAIDDDPATAAVFGTPATEILGSITPDIYSPAVSYFGDGTNFPAGNYTVSYVTGAFGWSGPAHWTVNFEAGLTQYYLTNGTTPVSWNPGLFATYPDQAGAEAAFAGASYLYAHPGGPIGMYLGDNPYYDNAAGSPNPTFSLSPAGALAPRLLRVDWGFDVFISRIRLAYSGAGAGNAGVDYESSLSFASGHSPPTDIAFSSIPVPVDGAVHEVIFNPPVIGRGVVFYPDALLPAASSLAVILSQLQVFQDTSQGAPFMANPTTNQARVGCSGAVITPRAYTTATSFPFPQTFASILRSIQSLNFSSAVKLARETGGETVHQINGYETDRETKCKISVERHDYLALQNFLAGTLVVNPANGNLQETQYHAPNYTDRAPYFSLVAQSANGDPSALFVLPKCKIDGNLGQDLERDKVTTLEVDFVCFWDYNYTRQDGTVGGLYEQIFNNGGAAALHS